MRVPFDQRDEKVNNLKLALNMCTINTSYEDTELVYKLFNKTLELGGDCTIDDIVKIQVAHEKKWREYYESKKTKSP